jgi:hypothetical protein
MAVWYIFRILVCLDQEKSGNPILRSIPREDVRFHEGLQQLARCNVQVWVPTNLPKIKSVNLRKTLRTFTSLGAVR